MAAMTATTAAAQPQFKVPRWSQALGGFVSRHRSLMLRLARAESNALQDHLSLHPVQAPVYLCGLPRAGTTILLEALSMHADVGTHRYSDYPFVHLPYWWSRLAGHMPKSDAPPIERAHGDRILVTPQSPEALEESLWMSFFGHLHDAEQVQILDSFAKNPDFEAHYRAHVGKLLLARGKRRYVCKSSYNIARMLYLRKIFPDARFVVAVREPAAHVQSLMRQHARFTSALTENVRDREHMKRIGQFAFGPDRSPINVGFSRDIVSLWAKGEEVRGWARYWARIHGFVLRQMQVTRQYDGAGMILRYEDFCADPETQLRNVMDHAGLPATDTFIRAFATRVSTPRGYEASFSDAERAIIAKETGEIAKLLGYEAQT